MERTAHEDARIVHEDPHDTAIAVVIDKVTSGFVLIRSRRTGLWRFPGDRIRDEDIDPANPHDNNVAAKNAVIRITRERAGLNIQARRVIMMRRPIGMFYGYAGLADFKEFAPRNEETTKIFPFSEVSLLEMSTDQRTMFDRILQWIEI